MSSYTLRITEQKYLMSSYRIVSHSLKAFMGKSLCSISDLSLG